MPKMHHAVLLPMPREPDMNNPTNAELAGYLREWAKEMKPLEAGKEWLHLAADRLRQHEPTAPCPNCRSTQRVQPTTNACAACGRVIEDEVMQDIEASGT